MLEASLGLHCQRGKADPTCLALEASVPHIAKSQFKSVLEEHVTLQSA